MSVLAPLIAFCLLGFPGYNDVEEYPGYHLSLTNDLSLGIKFEGHNFSPLEDQASEFPLQNRVLAVFSYSPGRNLYLYPPNELYPGTDPAFSVQKPAKKKEHKKIANGAYFVSDAIFDAAIVGGAGALAALIMMGVI